MGKSKWSIQAIYLQRFVKSKYYIKIRIIDLSRGKYSGLKNGRKSNDGFQSRRNRPNWKLTGSYAIPARGNVK